MKTKFNELKWQVTDIKKYVSDMLTDFGENSDLSWRKN